MDDGRTKENTMTSETTYIVSRTEYTDASDAMHAAVKQARSNRQYVDIFQRTAVDGRVLSTQLAAAATPDGQILQD